MKHDTIPDSLAEKVPEIARRFGQEDFSRSLADHDELVASASSLYHLIYQQWNTVSRDIRASWYIPLAVYWGELPAGWSPDVHPSEYARKVIREMAFKAAENGGIERLDRSTMYAERGP